MTAIDKPRPTLIGRPPAGSALPRVRPQAAPVVPGSVLVAYVGRPASSPPRRAAAVARRASRLAAVLLVRSALAANVRPVGLEVPRRRSATDRAELADVVLPAVAGPRRAATVGHPRRVLRQHGLDAGHAKAADDALVDAADAGKVLSDAALHSQLSVVARPSAARPALGAAWQGAAPARRRDRLARLVAGPAGPVELARVVPLVPRQVPPELSGEVLPVSPEVPRAAGPNTPVASGQAARPVRAAETAAVLWNGERVRTGSQGGASPRRRLHTPALREAVLVPAAEVTGPIPTTAGYSRLGFLLQNSRLRHFEGEGVLKLGLMSLLAA